MGAMGELRYEPTEKRIRAEIDGNTVVDSTHALLVWEPRRVVPSYAVPAGDVRGELVPAAASAVTSDAPHLHPGIPFAAHSCPGTALNLSVAGERGEIAFRPDDPDLAGHVVLAFGGFDTWYEEDEPIVGHPRDPFHRVDVRRSSRNVRLELDGQLLAESTQARLLFETHMPTRFYLPREDVQAALRPSSRQTYCAYKGQASYWSVDGHDGAGDDLGWSYPEPLPDATQLTDLVAFYDDRLDVFVDEELRPRPATPIARTLLEEAGLAVPASGQQRH